MFVPTGNDVTSVSVYLFFGHAQPKFLDYLTKNPTNIKSPSFNGGWVFTAEIQGLVTEI